MRRQIFIASVIGIFSATTTIAQGPTLGVKDLIGARFIAIDAGGTHHCR